MSNVEFSKKLFNPLYFELKKDLHNKDIRFIWIYGGSSSSKTYTVSQALLTETIETNSNSAIFRKHSTELRDTIYSDFKGIINKWEIPIWQLQQNLIKSANGKQIRFKGMDDPEKVKGIAQFRYVLLEEMTSFDYADLKQVRKRLRGMPNQKVIGTWNPIDEDHWIKKEVIDNDTFTPVESNVTEKLVNKSGNTVIYRTTYKDNYWIVGSPCGSYGYYDRHTIEDFEKDKKEDYNYYRIYALGEWGRIDVGGEFYKAFDTKNNTTDKVYDDRLPLHISFDENVNPYMTLLVFQAKGNEAWQIDEICLKHPKNTLSDTLAEFKRKYRTNKNGLFIYGDRTSLKADTKLEKGQNFFTIIKRELEEYKPILRLPTANPPVALRGNFINDTFRLKLSCKFYVNENCQNTVNDFKYVKEANDGGKLKEKTKDPITKISHEKYGHTSDATDYFLCQYFSKEFRAYQIGNKKVDRLIQSRKSFKY